jgi:hypothetical protein
VHRAGRELAQPGSQKVFTLNQMLEAWAQIIGEIEAGYQWDIGEFANDVSCRTWLAEAWPLLTERIRSARSAELAELDARFRVATVECDHPAAESHWWLRRRPNS